MRKISSHRTPASDRLPLLVLLAGCPHAPGAVALPDGCAWVATADDPAVGDGTAPRTWDWRPATPVENARSCWVSIDPGGGVSWMAEVGRPDRSATCRDGAHTHTWAPGSARSSPSMRGLASHPVADGSVEQALATMEQASRRIACDDATAPGP